MLAWGNSYRGEIKREAAKNIRKVKQECQKLRFISFIVNWRFKVFSRFSKFLLNSTG
jgi:hypothetical protein